MLFSFVAVYHIYHRGSLEEIIFLKKAHQNKRISALQIFSNILYVLCPRIGRSGAYSFWPVCLSVRPFVHPSVCPFVVRKNFYIGQIFCFIRVRAFIFHTSIPCDKICLMIRSSRSSVKVKVEYVGHRCKRMAVAGVLVFH